MNRRSFILSASAATVAAMTMAALDVITPRRWKPEPEPEKHHWDEYDGRACRVEVVKRGNGHPTYHTGVWGWAHGSLIEPASSFPMVIISLDYLHGPNVPAATLAMCVNDLAFYPCDDEGNYYLDGLEEFNPQPIEVKR